MTTDRRAISDERPPGAAGESSPIGVSPDQLTAVLRAQGHLPGGSVIAVEVLERFETPPSTVAKLRLSYSDDAPMAAPPRLFLKAPKPHKLRRGRREVRFYAEVAPLMPDVPLPRCYGVGEDVPSGMPFVLLEDLSATHGGIEWPASRDAMEGMLDALARLHAAWWDRSDLNETAGEHVAHDLRTYFADSTRFWSKLEPGLHERLPAEQCQAYERMFPRARTLALARATHGRHMTLCHPDSHDGNFLLPRGDGPVLIVDWHGYRLGWGAQDVAMLVARSQPAAHLGDGGAALVRFYYERLLHHGVRDYTWDACWDDYRLEAIANLFWNHLMWIVPKLDVVLRVFDACGCAELLGE